MLGREIGGILCEADDAFFTPIGSSAPEEAPVEEGGMSMTPAGPSMDGGFSSDPSLGGSSSSGSYVDPETGEPITNKDGKTIAGDPNADPGTYIGEVDDPNFTNDQSNSCAGSSESSSSTQGANTDNSTPDATKPDDTSSEETQETSDPDPGPKPDDDMPADDGSGSGGPAGPRTNVAYGSSAEISSGAENFYLPPDDSVGGGTPRSNVANAANSAASSALLAVASSRSHLT
jgi:hypothetical protein